MNADELRTRAARVQPPGERDGKAPAERGERLGAIPKRDGEELRISWDEYEGHPFLSLRLWRRDRHGTWWPVKDHGCSVGLRGLPVLAEALAAALDKAEAHAR